MGILTTNSTTCDRCGRPCDSYVMISGKIICGVCQWEMGQIYGTPVPPQTQQQTIITQPGSGATQLAEEILREYVEVEDVNQNEPVSLLPLTIIDMMEEYAERLSDYFRSDFKKSIHSELMKHPLTPEECYPPNDIGIKVVVQKGDESNHFIHEYEIAMQQLVDKVVSEKHANQDEPNSTDTQNETK